MAAHRQRQDSGPVDGRRLVQRTLRRVSRSVPLSLAEARPRRTRPEHLPGLQPVAGVHGALRRAAMGRRTVPRHGGQPPLPGQRARSSPYPKSDVALRPRCEHTDQHAEDRGSAGGMVPPVRADQAAAERAGGQGDRAPLERLDAFRLQLQEAAVPGSATPAGGDLRDQQGRHRQRGAGRAGDARRAAHHPAVVGAQPQRLPSVHIRSREGQAARGGGRMEAGSGRRATEGRQTVHLQ